MPTLTTLLWNAHANSATQQRRVVQWVDRWVSDNDVQRIVLLEAKGARPALREWARTNGFRLYQERGSRLREDERGDTAVLIRRRGKGAVKVKRQWTAVMDRAWVVVSHNVWHRPRRHRRLVLDVAGKRVRTSAEHWPTRTRPNAAAWAESYDSALKFLRRPGLALVDGDLNADYHAASALADEVGGRVKGERPDWCILNQRRRVNVIELGEGGSDHCALLVTVVL